MVSKHGGDIFGRDIKLDFSVNLNPLGTPESVIRAVSESAADSDRYPDPYCRELTKKLSEHESISAENIVCGNGADDLIYRVIYTLKPRRAVIPKPSFSEYAKALCEVGCEIARHEPKDIPAALDTGADMLILCSPNNPTGRLVEPEALKMICEKCLENNIVFLCDECFIDLCENAGKCTVKRFMNDNIIVLKAFTKTYAMAGLRLGYALFGSAELAERVRDRGQFWSVSTVAQAAGIAALGETLYVETARKTIAEERKFLSDKLRDLGFEVCRSDANFILFRCDIPLDEMLLSEGIMIRNCSDFSGLGEGYFRAAVKLRSENEALVKAMEKVMKWQET